MIHRDEIRNFPDKGNNEKDQRKFKDRRQKLTKTIVSSFFIYLFFFLSFYELRTFPPGTKEIKS